MPCLSYRTALALVLGLWAAAGVPGASAHGGPPRTRHVAIHPSDPDRLLLQTSYGLVFTADGGASWSWVCPQAASWGIGGDPPFILTEEGTIFAALFAGLSRGDATACAWDLPSADLDRTPVSDVRVDPGNPARLLAVASGGGGGNRIFGSTDGGRTWAPTAQPPRDVLYETLRFAPSNPARAYLSGGTPPSETEPRTATVYRSDDGGETFPLATPIALRETDRAVFMLAVSPTDPDVAFLHVSSFGADDGLLRTVDGGARWETILEIPTLRGLAIAPDGDTVWVTGFEGGLQRSTDGGDTFEVLDPDLDGECLVHDGEALWVCGEVRLTGFALARSTDGGETLETVYADEDVAPAACPDGSSAALMCSSWVADLCFDLALDEPFCTVPPSMMDAGVPDAAQTPAAAEGEGGCAAAPSSGLAGGFPALLALAWSAGLTRRRRRGSPRPARRSGGPAAPSR